MTHIEFKVNHEGDYTGFKVEGHTGYSRMGSDIVCAAISSTSQMVILGLATYLKTGCTVIGNIDDLKPLISCEIPYTDQTVQLWLKTLYKVMLQLEEQYPDYLTVWVGKK